MMKAVGNLLAFLFVLTLIFSGCQQSSVPTEKEQPSRTATVPGRTTVKSGGMPSRDASADSVFSKDFINLYNKFRENKGRSPLTFYQDLNLAAANRAAEIRDKGYTGSPRKDAVYEYVFQSITPDTSPADLVASISDVSGSSSWMTNQMLLDWYPKAGFAKVGEVAVLLLLR